jgi:uncharacterized protein (UPF0332 family)
MGTALNYAYKKRIVGDYGMGASVTKEDAEGLLETAQEFVGKVQSYLDQWSSQEGQT